MIPSGVSNLISIDRTIPLINKKTLARTSIPRYSLLDGLCYKKNLFVFLLRPQSSKLRPGTHLIFVVSNARTLKVLRTFTLETDQSSELPESALIYNGKDLITLTLESQTDETKTSKFVVFDCTRGFTKREFNEDITINHTTFMNQSAKIVFTNDQGLWIKDLSPNNDNLTQKVHTFSAQETTEDLIVDTQRRTVLVTTSYKGVITKWFKKNEWSYNSKIYALDSETWKVNYAEDFRNCQPTKIVSYDSVSGQMFTIHEMADNALFNQWKVEKMGKMTKIRTFSQDDSWDLIKWGLALNSNLRNSLSGRKVLVPYRKYIVFQNEENKVCKVTVNKMKSVEIFSEAEKSKFVTLLFEELGYFIGDFGGNIFIASKKRFMQNAKIETVKYALKPAKNE